MAIALESGSQSPGNGAVSSRDDVASFEDHMSRQDHGSDGTVFRSPYQTSSLEIHLGPKEATQISSPSPSLSTRSLSPSLVLTDSSAEWMGTLSKIPNGYRYSGSFDKTASLKSDSKVNGDGISSLLPISKTLSAHELHDIHEEKVRKRRRSSVAKLNGEVLKLSADEMEELTSAPESLPVTSPRRPSFSQYPLFSPSAVLDDKGPGSDLEEHRRRAQIRKNSTSESQRVLSEPHLESRLIAESLSPNTINRPRFSSRTTPTPQATSNRTSFYPKGTPNPTTSPKRKLMPLGTRPGPLDLSFLTSKRANGSTRPSASEQPPSPIPQSIPLPPMSIPTYLQLELSSSRPSPLYIYRSHASENPYESSKIKFERLLNFLILPPQLEQVLYFGSLACLDSWLYTFTILPLRFFKALSVLIQWWGHLIAKEAQFIAGFIYHGSGRMWHRQREGHGNTDSSSRSRSVSKARQPTMATTTSYQSQSSRVPEAFGINGFTENLKAETERKPRPGWGRKHRRTKSQPSSLSSYHKADLLQGAVIIFSCIIMMKLDASRMYHSIRGQNAMKLYVLYNLLEVCDRLFSALGQDIFECLFSDETLERDCDGRSKILRPLGMFILALIYNVIHATALFYQVITLNVAVNSYSNALLTLLMSNQFVEIKSTVFKKFEKDNLFQLTCADVVERFQLWLMLMIIALRNIVEVGGLSVIGDVAETAGEALKNATTPTRSNSILPNSFTAFTFLPSWSGEVLTPFLFVLGSEMLVDWIKHAYISKFNGVKPAVYQRYLDVLAKDYYTNAFVNQNLIKRLGLPVIPLSCLFIRSSVQTYNMFLATHVPAPIQSTATALSVESSPATTAALEHFDNLIRRALGRSAFGVPDPTATNRWYVPTADDAIAALTMLVFFLGAFFVLLACKLVLGMVLLKFARNRYCSMKKRENQNYETGGKRVGGWGMVEVDEDKKRWIYDDDPETLRKLREKERMAREKAERFGGGQDFGKISRYEMSAKRIW